MKTLVSIRPTFAAILAVISTVNAISAPRVATFEVNGQPAAGKEVWTRKLTFREVK